MSRKSQAAMEFIMTYGWAILVVLVAVGALAYFGVLSPDKFLPSRCSLQSGIACVDHKVTATAVTVRLTNSLGYDIDQICVKAGGCGTFPTGASCGPSSTETLINGESKTYTVTCAVPLIVSKYNQPVNVSYRVTDTEISHNNVGQLTARVE